MIPFALLWRYFCTRKLRFTDRASLEAWQQKNAGFPPPGVSEKPVVPRLSRAAFLRMADDGQNADDDPF